MEMFAIKLLDQTGIKNHTVEHLNADPSGADLWNGRSWYNTVEKKIKYVEDGAIIVSAAQSLVSAALASVGLGADGSLAALTGTNYLTGSATVREALVALDAQTKAVRDVADVAVTSVQLTAATNTAKTEAIAAAGTAATQAIATQSTADRAYTDTSVNGLDTTLRTLIDSKVNGLSWKAPVKAMGAFGEASVPPGGLVEGDRVISTIAGKILVKGGGNEWGQVIVPSAGDTVIVLDVDLSYTFDGETSSWVRSSATNTYTASGALEVTGFNVTLKNAGVSAQYLGSDVAGAGLQGGNGSALALKVVEGGGLVVDQSGLNIDTDYLDGIFLKPADITYGTFEFAAVAADTSFTVTHGLATNFPAVTVYDADTGKVIIPSEVVRIDANTTRIDLSVARKVAARFVK